MRKGDLGGFQSFRMSKPEMRKKAGIAKLFREDQNAGKLRDRSLAIAASRAKLRSAEAGVVSKPGLPLEIRCDMA